ERLAGVLEVVATGHHAVEVHGTGGNEMDCGGPGVGVAEHPCHVDFVVGDVADGQGVLVGAHPDQDDVARGSHCLDAADYCGGHPGGVDERVDRFDRADVDGRGVEDLGGAELQCLLATRRHEIRDHDSCRAERAG